MSTVKWEPTHTEEKRRHDFLRAVFLGQHRCLLTNKAGERVEGLMHVPTDVNWLGERYTRKFSAFVMPFMPSVKTAAAGEQTRIDLAVQKLRLDTLVTSLPNIVSYAGVASIKMYFSKAAAAPQVKIWGVEEGEFAYWEYLPGDASDPVAVQFWKTENKKDAATGDNLLFRVCERYEKGLANDIVIRLNDELLKPTTPGNRKAEILQQIETIKQKATPGDFIVFVTVDAFALNKMGNLQDTGGQVPIFTVYGDSVPACDVWILNYLPAYRLQNVDAAGKNRGESDYTISLYICRQN